MGSGATFPGEFVDKICAVLDFGGWLRITYYSDQYTPMSFLQAHQVLTYESAENHVLGFLGEVGMTIPEDPGKYSRLSGAGPNRFVSGAALFLYIGFGFAKYLLRDCVVSKDRQKIRASISLHLYFYAGCSL